MTHQSFPEPLVHRDAHDTEQAAADSVAGSAATVRNRVLTLLREAGGTGLTDDEGAEAYRRRHHVRDADRLTFGRRRHELEMAGLVDDSGQRRLTPRGRKAIVWVAATDVRVTSSVSTNTAAGVIASTQPVHGGLA